MPSEEAEMASQTEDRILEALKKVGAHVDSAVGAFTNLSHLGQAGMQTEVKHPSTPSLEHLSVSFSSPVLQMSGKLL